MNYEPCTSLPVTVEDSLQTESLDTDRQLQLSGMDTPAKSSENAQQTDGSPACQCGKGTLGCLIHPSTPEAWIALQRDSLAKICQLLDDKVDWEMEREAACTVKSFALQALYDPNSSSWKTSQQSFLTDSEQCLQTWPRWGWTQDGAAYAHRMSGRYIAGTDGGSLLPTPSGTTGNGNHVVGRLDEWGGSSNPWRGTEIGKVRCPSFEEWMMGFPIHFTVATGYETRKSHSKPQPPGNFSEGRSATLG